MTQLDPYLFFDGNCTEAMRFYERTFGGKIEMMMTHKDAPPGTPVPPGAENRVMHARLVFGDNGRVLMASDAMPGHPYDKMQGFSLSWNSSDAKDAKRVFDALAQGGEVRMPLQKTFWAEAFGMLVDKYGTPWMVNCEASKA
ncbi:MAG TPA: VOC family protein [Casimicrobiaceae bacterium]|nr:VOC family protein [Casimicrobiaceae bacterium]